MKKYIYAGALLCALAAACKKTPGPQGPAGPSFTGAIAGNIMLYDEWGQRQYTGVDGVVISLKNGAQQVTDSNGHFLFPGITTGNYTLRASVNGYGATMLPNVSFISDTIYQQLSLTKRPYFNVNWFGAFHNPGSAYDSLVATFEASSKERRWLVFAGKGGDPGAAGNYKLVYTGTILPNTGTSVIRVPVADLNSAGMFFGETVWYAACSYVVEDHSSYVDIGTGKTIYTPIGTPLYDTTIAP